MRDTEHISCLRHYEAHAWNSFQTNANFGGASELGKIHEQGKSRRKEDHKQGPKTGNPKAL